MSEVKIELSGKKYTCGKHGEYESVYYGGFEITKCPKCAKARYTVTIAIQDRLYDYKAIRSYTEDTDCGIDALKAECEQFCEKVKTKAKPYFSGVRDNPEDKVWDKNEVKMKERIIYGYVKTGSPKRGEYYLYDDNRMYLANTDFSSDFQFPIFRCLIIKDESAAKEVKNEQ